MARFSERYGHKPVRQQLQHDQMDRLLRVRIWDFIFSLVEQWADVNTRTRSALPIARVWVHHYEEPIDKLPDYSSEVIRRMRESVFNDEFHQVYDLCEFFAGEIADRDGDAVYKGFNEVFERNLAPYRFVDGRILRVDAETDVTAIESALEDSEGIPGVHHHLDSALTLLADRDSPHYSNSIKESISAVESCAKLITKQKKATLGEALKALKGAGVEVPGSLENGWSALYGYTSNAQGIRHAALDKPNITQAEAKYWLVTCSAFVSLLLAHASTVGLLEKTGE